MALGPDPNRWTPDDPDARRGNLGDLRSTRFGMGSTAIVAVLVVLVAVFLVVAL